MSLVVRPWDLAGPQEINHLVRSAALAMFENDLQDWQDLRFAEKWSDDDIQTFLNRYSLEIKASLKKVERWITGEDILH